MSTNSWHVFATHTVAETWCQKILCHLCQWHCAGWSMAGCSRLCNPFPRHRRCRCASGQLSTTMTNWPISMRCLADDLIGLGIKSSASPINEDLVFRSSDIQIWNVGLCFFFQTSWIWVWHWTIGLQTGSYWHTTKPSALGYTCQVSWPEKNTKIKKVQKQQMRLKFSSPMADLHLVHYRIWQG